MMMRVVGLLIAVFGVGGVALAQPVLDGSLVGDDAIYGNVLSVQRVQTQFGNAVSPDYLGSELDAAYATVDGSTLYLLLTGNLEANFNKLDIFIDSIPGGQNQIGPDTNNGGTNPPNDGWATNFSGVGEGADPPNGPGFMFDADFAADYLIIARNGDFGGARFGIDYAVVGGGATAFEDAFDVFGGTFAGSNPNALPGAGIGVAFDRTNELGVPGGTAAATPAEALSAVTGVELAIPLSAIGNPASMFDIKVSAMINGSNQDFLSNQFLGSLSPPQANLGGDGAGMFTGDVAAVDLKQFPGNQFFVVPEPAGVLLLSLGMISALCLRRS